MSKFFNASGDCKPELHYMVDIESRLKKIRAMIERGEYFTINRARQYGKTTTLRALEQYLKNDYVVVSLDFQVISSENFENEQTFTAAFSGELLDNVEDIPEEIKKRLTAFIEGTVRNATLLTLLKTMSEWCRNSEKKIILIIDEVDSATNNQVFLDFLAQLRGYYINRDKKATFQSVILAGVYDVKNIKRKLHPDDEHKVNSPWNIAADFLVDMSFSVKDITGMLEGYENDWYTGMDISDMSSRLFEYTSGYPFLISRLCKLLDERIAGSVMYPNKSNAWTKEGFLEAIKILLAEKNTLFESLGNKLLDYPELYKVLYTLLFTGKGIPYNPLNKSIEAAEMFGFIKNIGGNVVISNRIFEMKIWKGNAYNTRGEEQLSNKVLVEAVV